MKVVEVKPHIRTIVISSRPTSMQKTIDVITEFWRSNEIDIPLNEVLRTEKPQKIFWNIRWG